MNSLELIVGVIKLATVAGRQIGLLSDVTEGKEREKEEKEEEGGAG